MEHWIQYRCFDRYKREPESGYHSRFIRSQ